LPRSDDIIIFRCRLILLRFRHATISYAMPRVIITLLRIHYADMLHDDDIIELRYCHRRYAILLALLASALMDIAAATTLRFSRHS